MIHLTVGLPCRFSEWCESILRALLIAAHKPPVSFVANTLDQLGREVLAQKPPSVMMVVREPDKALSDAIMATASPILLTLDTPDAAVWALMADYHERFPMAVRRVASCLTTYLPLMKYQNALVLQASDKQESFETARAMARHFGLDLDDAAMRSAVRSLPERAPEIDGLEFTDKQTADALAARAAVRGDFGYSADDDHTLASIQAAALDPIWAHLNGSPLSEAHWHPALMSLGDRPAESPTGVIDATGSRRCLAFGPYIQLPAGSWSCSVLLGCAPNAVGLALTLDVFAGFPLNSMEVTVTEPGLFEVEMSFVNPSPDAHLEVRIFSAKPSFEGDILVGSARLFPHRAKRLRAAE